MSVDELKKLTTVDLPTTIDARNKDIQLAAFQPKIFTANAMVPSQWHPTLPHDLFTTSDECRANFGADTKAVGKRIAWAFVHSPLIPEATREAYARRA